MTPRRSAPAAGMDTNLMSDCEHIVAARHGSEDVWASRELASQLGLPGGFALAQVRRFWGGYAYGYPGAWRRG
jgi:hypothetical protein